MRVVALTCSSVDRILVYPVHSNRSAFVYDPLLLLLLPLKTNFQPALVHYLDYDLSLHSFLEQISYNIFLWLLANLSSYFSSLLDDKDDNQRSLGAIEADGPSSLPPARSWSDLTIPWKHDTCEYPDYGQARLHRPTTPRCAGECWGSRVGMIDSHCKPCWRAAFQQTDRASGRRGGKRESPPCILRLIKCYYPAQQEVPVK